MPARLAQRRARLMGSDAQSIVYAPSPEAAEALADLAMERLVLLESCWSRFRDDSELTALNARAGTGPVPVSDDLVALVSAMLQAWRWTGGACDPTVLTAMVRLGYDADFAEVVGRGDQPVVRVAAPAPGARGVRLDPRARTVSLPLGVALDPGAIGKGLAADLVAEEVLAAGATGVLVNVGGDVSARGDAGGVPWVVGVVDDRLPGSPVVEQWVLDHEVRAVCTSSSLRRRWGGRHHIIDPATGLPADCDVLQATIGAPTGWQAEAAATLALVRGSAAAEQWLRSEGLRARLVGTAEPDHQPLAPQGAHHA